MIGDPAVVGLVALTEIDLDEVEQFMTEGEVARWWPDFDRGEIRSFIEGGYVTPFRVVAEGATVGYAHVYHANMDEFWVAFGVPRATFGIDLSIGVASARNRGVGRAAVRLLVDRLFAWREVVRLQIDPDADNARAIRAYGAVGFVARGLYPGYDGETMLYMTIERVSARTSR